MVLLGSFYILWCAAGDVLGGGKKWQIVLLNACILSISQYGFGCVLQTVKFSLNIIVFILFCFATNVALQKFRACVHGQKITRLFTSFLSY